MSHSVSAAAHPQRFVRMGPSAKTLLRFVRTQPLGTLGLFLIVMMLFVGIFASSVAPYDPLATQFDALSQPPNTRHLMGTDSYGRDVLSRVIYGAKPAVLLGITTALLGSLIGGALGVTSAYFGGRVDAVLQLLNDILLAIPLIVGALAVVAILGRHDVYGIDVNLLIAITLPYVPVMARIMRGAALPVRASPYIDAARALGFSHFRVIFFHMVPNLGSPWLVMVSAFTAQTILLEAALSYLGLGVAEPTPAWGLMLSGAGLEVFSSAPWMVVFPGLAISIAVFSFSLLGDALRDARDPKFQR